MTAVHDSSPDQLLYAGGMKQVWYVNSGSRVNSFQGTAILMSENAIDDAVMDTYKDKDITCQ